MKFLIDENLPRALTVFVRGRGHEAISIVESRRRGLSDAEVWDWAARDRAVLVTLDLDFPIPGRRPAPVGVVLLRPLEPGVAAIIDLWRMIEDGEVLEDISGRVLSVRGRRMRSRPLP